MPEPAADASLRVLVVDDEPLARELLRHHLAALPDIAVVAEAADGIAAAQAIAAVRPDLVFMDIGLPLLNGIDALERAATVHLPLVVFVTGHDAYAIRAFEMNALDYLLKPVSEARLAEAVARARTRRAHVDAATDARHRIAALLDGPRAVAAPSGDEPSSPNGDEAGTRRRARRLVVRDRTGFLLLPVADIEALEAAGNYVRIVTAHGTYLQRATMAELEAVLDHEQFVRVHRSTIVNLDAIGRITPHASGDFEIRLASGRTLRMSRHYRRRLLP